MRKSAFRLLRPARLVAILVTSLLPAALSLSCGKPGEDGKPGPAASAVAQGVEPAVATALTVICSSDERGEIGVYGFTKDDLGGLGRRAAYVASVREKAPDVLLLQAGDLLGGGDAQSRLKAQVSVESLAEMRYDALTIGEGDLALGPTFLLQVVKDLKLPLVSTNTVLSDSHEPLLANPAIVKTLPCGKAVAIFGVISEEFAGALKPAGLAALPPEATLKRYLKGVAPGTVVVVLAHMSRGEAERLARNVQGIALIVVGHIQPARRPEPQTWKVGRTLLVQGKPKGRFVERLALEIDGSARLSLLIHEPVPLDSKLDVPPEFASRFQRYREELKRLVQSARPAGPAKYAVVEKCIECHKEHIPIWEKSTHARSIESLRKHGAEYDPECLRCHTTGYGETGGFVSLEATPEFASILCDECHGPGLGHLVKPEVPYSPGVKTSCLRCHDADFDPSFNYATAYAKIEHKGRPTPTPKK